MDRNFSRSLDATLDYEGGFVDHPRDPGGPTNLGVTLVNFRNYVKPDGTVDDLKRLTREQAGVVYRRQYWDAVMGSALPDGVDFAVFDMAVHSGPTRSAKFLQRIVGVVDDGKVGPATLKAVEAFDKDVLIVAFCDARMEFLRGLATWDDFGNGWKSRVAKVRVLASELAAQKVDAPVVIVKPVETEVEVPKIPEGADKPVARRWWAALPLIGTPLAAFVDMDTTSKLIVVGIVLVGIVAILFLGERIAARAKAIKKAFETV